MIVLIALLRAKEGFDFRDYSVPEEDPIQGARTDAQLRQAILDQMRPCHVIIFLAGVYASYSKWMDIEIALAQKGFQNPKPILAVRPRGNERVSKVVTDAADTIVGWNTDSVVNAIRALAR